MKKYINEIDNFEEFKNVVMNSEELKDLCIKYCEDNAYFWVGEVLHDIPKYIDYSISGYCDYIRVDGWNSDNWKAYIEVADWINGLDNEFAVFNGNVKKDIEQLHRYATALYEDDNGYIDIKAKDYNFMREHAKKITADLLGQVKDYCTAEYEYWYDIENCLDDAYQNDAFQEYYIDENGNLWEERLDRRVA